jgi:hypothetical protein
MAPRTADPDARTTLQDLLGQIARGEISREEGRRRLEELAERAQDPLIRRVLRELFPSLMKST